MTGCHPKEENDKIKQSDILSLRRTQKTIKVIDPKTGYEKYVLYIIVYVFVDHIFRLCRRTISKVYAVSPIFIQAYDVYFFSMCIFKN